MADAADVKSIVEIGSEYALGTRQVANYALEKGGVVHAIDPAPSCNVEDLKKTYGEALIFHEALSLEALPKIGAFDLALIDGDHNWYTVYHELKAIAENHAGLPEEAFPMLFFHDTGWPYGRRDLYYDIDTIPEAYRHPTQRAGIIPGEAELVDGQGLNPDLLHAVHEGGARNGVRTAIDDFIEESKIAFDCLFMPMLFGFGIVIARARLEKNPGLWKMFNYWGSAEGLTEASYIAEHFRNVCNVKLQAAERENKKLKENRSV